MLLWVVRHATTTWNEERRYQGHTDAPLSSQGIESIKSWLLPAQPDAVYASPLQRAYETAKILFPLTEIRLDARLRETGLGLWEGKTREEVHAQFGPLPNNGWYGLDYRGHRGETMREVMGRLQPWLEEVSCRPHRCVFVVSHKGTLTALYALATGWDNLSKPKVRLRFPNFHCFQLGEGGAVRLKQANVPLGGAERL